MKEQKVAIVTGAIKGIGLAIAKELASHGIKCALTYYDWLDSLEDMHKAMKAQPSEYMASAIDLTKPEQVQGFIKEVIDHFGQLDILVNNIERGGWPIVHGQYTEKQWRLEFETTVNAKYHLFNASLPFLKKDGGGAVINISSIAGIVGRAGPAGLIFHDCYSLANRAISSLTETWAREAAPEVRVNELMLGLFETRHGPATRGWGLLTPKQKEELLNHILLKRIGQPEEVAKCVYFLAEQATYMTGSIIRMDGGYVLGGEKVPQVPKGVVDPNAPTYGGSKPPKQ